MTATLDTALEPVHATEGRARRTLRNLRDQRGYAAIEGDPERPDLVRIQPWVETTYWRRVAAAGGLDAIYERADAPGEEVRDV